MTSGGQPPPDHGEGEGVGVGQVAPEPVLPIREEYCGHVTRCRVLIGHLQQEPVLVRVPGGDQQTQLRVLHTGGRHHVLVLDIITLELTRI